MPTALRVCASARGGWFNRADARSVGVTDRQLAGLLRRGEIVRLRDGIFAETCVAAALEPRKRHVLDVLAAQQRCPAGTASHESAILLWGGDLLRFPAHARLTVQPSYHRRYAGLVIHAATLPANHVARSQVAGCRVTTPARTIVDIGRLLSFRAAVVAADSLLRNNSVEGSDLAGVLDDCHGWPGVISARRVVDFADARSESPLESASRVLFHEWDVEPPELQHRIFLPGIGWVRTDFYWRRYRLVGEADGKVKYNTREDAWAEKRRQDALWEAGYDIVRWDWDGVFTTPAATVARVLAKFRYPGFAG